LKIFTSAIGQSNVQQFGELNQASRNHDKTKKDVIAQLSDQVMALTARMQEIENKPVDVIEW
jgi:hypothetical protein